LVLGEDRVDVVVHPDDVWLARAAFAEARVRILDRPPGTSGYRDLARGAEEVMLDDKRSVTVASLQDLLRVALTDPDAGSQAIALTATLRARRTHTGRQPVLSDEQAREAVERWLGPQAGRRIGA
jgi:hypothetical protein